MRARDSFRASFCTSFILDEDDIATSLEDVAMNEIGMSNMEV